MQLIKAYALSYEYKIPFTVLNIFGTGMKKKLCTKNNLLKNEK